MFYSLRSLLKLYMTRLHSMVINRFLTYASHSTNGTLESAPSGVSEIISALQYTAELNSFLEYDIIGCIENFCIELRIVVGMCVGRIRR